MRKYEVPNLRTRRLPKRQRCRRRSAPPTQGPHDLTDVPRSHRRRGCGDFDDASTAAGLVGAAGQGLALSSPSRRDLGKPGSHRRRRLRAPTSVYFPRRVIPSCRRAVDGLCSLNPESSAWRGLRQARRADGRCRRYHSSRRHPFGARLTYIEVALRWRTPAAPSGAPRSADAQLLDLQDVYRALLKARFKRGAVDSRRPAQTSATRRADRRSSRDAQRGAPP